MGKITGISLHIGLNELDASKYPMDPYDPDFPDGWHGKLGGCHRDAEAMCEIAKSQQLETTMLLSEKATVENVKGAVADAAGKLKAGDTFFISFAGHGGSIPDLTGDEREEGEDEFGVDEYDETWCLYDRHLIDDEKNLMYLDFGAGVQILELSDSCYSGTGDRSDDDEMDSIPGVRRMSRGMSDACYIARKEQYDQIQYDAKEVLDAKPEEEQERKASYLLISACQEDEIAGDGSPNGKFTGAVLTVWNKGIFRGTYKEFRDEVAQELVDSFKQDEADHARGVLEYPPIFQTPNLRQGEATDETFNANAEASIFQSEPPH